VTGREFRHAAEYALYRALSGVLLALPERVALALGGALGWFAGVVLRVRRADVDRHLGWAFPDATAAWRARVARASYVHLGREAIGTFRLAGMHAAEVRARTLVSDEDLAAFRRAVAEGKGVLVMTGHLGNWELGGAAFSARGTPLVAVAKGMANRRFGEALLQSRERLGMRIIDMSEAPREVVRTLRAGGVAGLVADQNAREQGVFVPFFGRLAATFRGPALFALRTGAPIFVGACLRKPGWPPRYQVRFQRLDPVSTGDLEADVQRLTEAHTAVLEQAVREAPEQYFWQHKRWKTRPPEEEPPPVRPVSISDVRTTPNPGKRP
jgi:KDO2-lipid IV(A) lauroyltransferase